MADLPQSLERVLRYPINYVEDWTVEGSRVEMSFSRRTDPWPWLVLPPWHPVVVDKIQYFAAVTGAWAYGSLGRDSKERSGTGPRTALTRIRWVSLARDAGPARRGTFRPFQGEESVGYELEIFDEAGRATLWIRGEGAAFEERDFGARRSASKENAATSALAPPSELARPEAVGLGPEGRSLISPLAGGDPPTVIGWVTSAEGFAPAHPFHTGTGDHVNAGHLVDCALEGAHLLLDTPGPLYCTGGEARFRRFVELDVPFEIALRSEEPEGDATTVHARMHQGGRETSSVRLDLRV